MGKCNNVRLFMKITGFYNSLMYLREDKKRVYVSGRMHVDVYILM